MVDKFKLGNKVKCKVSGFTGIAVAKCEYINGCVQYGVKPKVKKDEPGKMPDAIYIDEAQLVFVSKGVEVKKKKKDPGADNMPDAPSV